MRGSALRREHAVTDQTLPHVLTEGDENLADLVGAAALVVGSHGLRTYGLLDNIQAYEIGEVSSVGLFRLQAIDEAAFSKPLETASRSSLRTRQTLAFEIA